MTAALYEVPARRCTQDPIVGRRLPTTKAKTLCRSARWLCAQRRRIAGAGRAGGGVVIPESGGREAFALGQLRSWPAQRLPVRDHRCLPPRHDATAAGSRVCGTVAVNALDGRRIDKDFALSHAHRVAPARDSTMGAGLTFAGLRSGDPAVADRSPAMPGGAARVRRRSRDFASAPSPSRRPAGFSAVVRRPKVAHIDDSPGRKWGSKGTST